MDRNIDVAEILGLLILGGIAVTALFMGEAQITNTAVSLIGGYMAKTIKSGFLTTSSHQIHEVDSQNTGQVKRSEDDEG